LILEHPRSANARFSVNSLNKAYNLKKRNNLFKEHKNKSNKTRTNRPVKGDPLLSALVSKLSFIAATYPLNYFKVTFVSRHPTYGLWAVYYISYIIFRRLSKILVNTQFSKK
jgi:hypothetical protein